MRGCLMLLALAAFAAAPAYADGTQVLYVKEAVSSALGSADGPGDHSYAMRMAADVVAAGLGSLREAEPESADLVHIGVLDLYSEASQGGDLSEKAAQVREALGRIEPASPDPALAASLLLGSADEASRSTRAAATKMPTSSRATWSRAHGRCRTPRATRSASFWSWNRSGTSSNR